MLSHKENIKICVLGQLGVGKSSLTLQFTQHHFPTSFDPYVEDVYQRDVVVGDKTYTIHVLDTAVQDEYSPLKDLQLKEADAIMLVYSIGSVESFSKIGDSYRHIMRNHETFPPVALVANQSDLVGSRQVGTSEGEELAREFGIKQYMETSAKLNLNITEAFMGLIDQVIASRAEKASSAFLSSSEDDFAEKKPLRSHRARSPTLSETSKPKTFTIGASLERQSTESSDEAPVQSVASRQKQITKRTSQQKKLNKTQDSEKESSGGCCIVM